MPMDFHLQIAVMGQVRTGHRLHYFQIDLTRARHGKLVVLYMVIPCSISAAAFSSEGRTFSFPSRQPLDKLSLKKDEGCSRPSGEEA
jgi:hypothetical protein